MTIMPVLSPQARDLISICRSALHPTDEDRVRVAGCLQAILGEAALPADVVAPAANALGWKIVLLGAIGVGVVSGLFASAVQSRARQAPNAARANNTPTFTTAASGSNQSELPPASMAAPAPIASSNTAQSAGPRLRPDPLTQEIALLTRATGALNAGRVREALSILAEHERRFPEGVLSIERLGAKAKALCALGRAGEARAELSQLPAGSLASLRLGECRPIVGHR